MIVQNENSDFNTSLYLSDWRYSAAAVGLYRYFEFNNLDYKIEEDCLSYNREDAIGEEAQNLYLDFVENYFSEGMHHLVIKEFNGKEELSEDEKSLYGDKIKATTLLKKIFKEYRKYDKSDCKKINDLIAEYRYEIIRETYRYGKSTYSNFANTNALFKEPMNVCRLSGYYVDLPKKSKSVAYNWNYNTFNSQDEPEFDFIPFAFSKSREAFFINNNYKLKELIRVNDRLNEEIEREENNKNSRIALFITSSSIAEFTINNVELIVKNRDEGFFRTLYLRKDSAEIFTSIHKRFNQEKRSYYHAVTRPLKINFGSGKTNDGGYIDLLKESSNAIINMQHQDELIELLLREKDYKGKGSESSGERAGEYSQDLDIGFRINELIRVNRQVYLKEEKMSEKELNFNIMKAKEDAQAVVSSLRKNAGSNYVNKIRSYRTKLTSSLTFKDYDRFNTILLQLSTYSAVQLQSADCLFKDFEKYKNVAYTFVNNLSAASSDKAEGKEDDNKEEVKDEQ